MLSWKYIGGLEGKKTWNTQHVSIFFVFMTILSHPGYTDFFTIDMSTLLFYVQQAKPNTPLLSPTNTTQHSTPKSSKVNPTLHS